MYALVMAFAFFFLPMSYFYFEEKDDDTPQSFGRVCCTNNGIRRDS